MLSTHLRHRELYRVRNLRWRRHRRVRRFVTAQLPGQIPDHPPMHRRPVHSDPGGHLDHLRAAQNRPNRVQTLLNYDKTTNANPGLPESRRPAKTSNSE
jgi:hypothetical protein